MLSFFFLTGCSGNNSGPPLLELTPHVEVSPSTLQISPLGGEQTLIVKANMPWNILIDGQAWYSLSVKSGYTGETAIRVTFDKNITETTRKAILSFTCGTDYKLEYTLTQEKGTVENYIPAGYTLVWQDEFNNERLPDGKTVLPNTDDWWYETGASGWGNNELQNYIAGFSGTDTCAVIKNGILNIIAKKRKNEVLSIRMNTVRSWTYGYFEARLKLPGGRGTWPAFWMMPKNYTAWPDDGEIDIMEEVGYHPEYVSSSVHCKAYNHVLGTQKTAERWTSTAESDFHIYALEWTANNIKTYIDGVLLFTFDNDKLGNKDTWPFNVPFYLKLNLAWGGNWGGAQGVDETKLPAVYQIDYVRVYQKNSN